MTSTLRSLAAGAALALLFTACSSSTDAGGRDIPWARLAGRLAYSRQSCSSGCQSSLFILDASHQEIMPVKTLPGLTFMGLAWAPDGRITYVELPSDGFFELHGLFPDQGSPLVLFVPGGPASWSADGRAAYPCIDFTLCVDGTAFLGGDFAVTLSRPAWSKDGTRIVVGGSDAAALNGLVAVDVRTKALVQLRPNPAGSFAYNPLYSPSGEKIVFEVGVVNSTVSEIWVMSADGSGAARLTTGHADREPAWSPDGSEIALVRDGQLYVMDADGSSVVQVTTDGAASLAWAP
jgi:WD40 repeat protein